MKTLMFLISLLSLDATADYEFMVGSWISDSGLSFDRNEKFAELTAVQKEMLFNNWPEVVWEIDLATLKVIDQHGNTFESSYFIRPITEWVFEITIDVDGGPDIAIVEKTDFGFCATFTHQHLKLDFELPSHTDCFRSNST